MKTIQFHSTDNENHKPVSDPIPYPESEYLSGSVFFSKSTTQNTKRKISV